MTELSKNQTGPKACLIFYQEWMDSEAREENMPAGYPEFVKPISNAGKRQRAQQKLLEGIFHHALNFAG